MKLGFSFLQSWRDLRVILCLGFIFLATSMVFSLQAPIYPPEATRKGATSTEYGLVLGIYEIVILVMSPITSNLCLRFGAWTVFNSCAVLVGMSTVSFGFLGYVQQRVMFVGLSFLLRILEGIGASGVCMAVYSFLTKEFHDNSAAVFGILEVSYGAGLAVGPVVGSLIYGIGVDGSTLAFLLPFVVLGSLHFVSAILTNCILRSNPKSASSEETASEKKKELSFKHVITMPTMLYFATFIIIGTFNYGFLAALLATYLEKLGVSTTGIGLAYLFYGITYTISSPIWAGYSNRMKSPIFLMLAGEIIFVLVFLLFLLSSKNVLSVPLAVAAVGILGIAHGALLMSAYVLCMREAGIKGYDDEKSVSAQISAFWLSSHSLGGFLGPSVAGFLFAQTTFFYTTIVFLLANVLLTCTIPVFLLLRVRRNDSKSENTE